MAIVDVLNGKYYGAQGISQALVNHQRATACLKGNLDPAGKTWLLWLILQFETTPSAFAPHDHIITFGYGAASVWLASKTRNPQTTVIRNNLKGSLIDIEADTGPKYFGLGIPQMLLVPQLAVTRILSLKPGPILDGLTLFDEKGQKAIVARTWRTKFVRGDDFGPAYPLIEGMDVLIRLDLLEILEEKCSPNRICFCSRHTELADGALG